MPKLSVVISLLLFLPACASKLVISSQPAEAEVYARNEKTGANVFIGKTPIAKALNEFQDKLDTGAIDGSFFLLEFKKPDYVTKEVVLPASRWNTLETHLHVELEKDKGQASHLLIQHLLNAQSFMSKGLVDRAKLEVDRALKLDPKFAWGYIMSGQIQYISRNFNDSLLAFEKAIEIDPENEQALKMLTRVRQKMESEAKP